MCEALELNVLLKSFRTFNEKKIKALNALSADTPYAPQLWAPQTTREFHITTIFGFFPPKVLQADHRRAERKARGGKTLSQGNFCI